MSVTNFASLLCEGWKWPWYDKYSDRYLYLHTNSSASLASNASRLQYSANFYHNFHFEVKSNIRHSHLLKCYLHFTASLTMLFFLWFKHHKWYLYTSPPSSHLQCTYVIPYLEEQEVGCHFPFLYLSPIIHTHHICCYSLPSCALALYKFGSLNVTCWQWQW